MKYLAVIGYIIIQENKEYIVHTKGSTSKVSNNQPFFLRFKRHIQIF